MSDVHVPKLESRDRGKTAYATPPVDDSNSRTFFSAVLIYYGDMVVQEPRLLKMYDAILPRLDAVLGEKSNAAYVGKKAVGEAKK